jgi:hypothetical protein
MSKKSTNGRIQRSNLSDPSRSVTKAHRASQHVTICPKNGQVTGHDMPRHECTPICPPCEAYLLQVCASSAHTGPTSPARRRQLSLSVFASSISLRSHFPFRAAITYLPITSSHFNRYAKIVHTADTLVFFLLSRHQFRTHPPKSSARSGSTRMHSCEQPFHATRATGHHARHPERIVRSSAVVHCG